MSIQEQIEILKGKLRQSDFKILKYIEKEITEEEYTLIKAQRQEWRDEINELEKQLRK